MITQIKNCSREWLERARQYIVNDEVVAFHTETVYGLGANAYSDDAVQKIFALKGRPADNPLIVHVHEGYDIRPLVDEIPGYAEKLRNAYKTGPLTLIYPSTGKVSKFVSCGLNTLAIRVPSSPVAQEFLKAVNLPVAAPSANRSKHVSPVTAGHVYEDFAGTIPLILDGGTCDGGIESTVLDCTGEIPVILRAGLVTREQIAAVAGDCGVYEKRAGEKPKSPGMAYKHYSPACRTAYFTGEDAEKAVAVYRGEETNGGTPCFLCESKVAKNLISRNFRALDLGGTGEEMAQKLYAALRSGEKQATLLIAIEPSVRGGVMDGVMNRLTRAFGRVGDET